MQPIHELLIEETNSQASANKTAKSKQSFIQKNKELSKKNLKKIGSD